MRLCIVVGLALSVLVPACVPGGVVGHGKDGAAGGGGNGGDGGNGGGGSGGASGGAGSGGAGTGEPCADVGVKRDCNPAACKRGSQECRPGSATVTGGTWGPCEGVTTVPGCAPPDAPCDCAKPTIACEDYCKGRDAGAETPPSGCECPAGLTRWCHGGGKACSWGKQKCVPGGTWGPCEPVKDKPMGCESTAIYSHCCCVAAGECCEDDSDHYNPKKSYKDGSGPSEGSCPAAACAPPPPAPAPMCPGKGECVPGAERYVTPTFGLAPSWSKQVCLADGSWGASMSAPPPPGCSPTLSDPMCCVAAGACCNFSNYYGCSYGKCPGECWKKP